MGWRNIVFIFDINNLVICLSIAHIKNNGGDLLYTLTTHFQIFFLDIYKLKTKIFILNFVMHSLNLYGSNMISVKFEGLFCKQYINMSSICIYYYVIKLCTLRNTIQLYM